MKKKIGDLTLLSTLVYTYLGRTGETIFELPSQSISFNGVLLRLYVVDVRSFMSSVF